jgi:class 3 adenylate cyclase/tetratricopeptide (TPR) repeat protein
MRCPSCSRENPEGALFCMRCGAKLQRVCPQCGTELPPDPDVQFCFACGSQVATGEATQEAGSAAARALRRLAPREFAERLLATRGQVAGERRIVTMLFSDVKGSTPMAERLDPEEVLEIMDGAFDVLIEPITRYEGALARLMGDGILAFFGAPIAHEDDAERACRAALEILEGAQRYAARLEEERAIAGFNVRVGIHTGLVVVGEVGSDLRVEYTAMGEAVNLASRMEEAAEPGTVLITEDTHRLIAALFETEALGPVQVRGKAEPVPVYRVLAPLVVAGKPRGIAGLESPLVGRDAEVQALREVLERLQAGVGGIVTIVGEAGIGKSRLVAELQKAATPLGVRWVEGRCLSYGESMAYLPWVDMLHGLLGMSVGDAPTEVRDSLRRFVGTLCTNHFDEVYPYLGRMMSLPLEQEVEERLEALEPQGLKVLTFRAVERVLGAGTREAPLVLVCEDLHWADASSLELLEQVLALTDRASLLLMCAFRPYRDHGCWGIRETASRLYPHRHTSLFLNTLSASDSEILVGNLLEVEALPRPLRERILEHAEGNPFYVEEVIRSLIDSGAIVYAEPMEQWQATRRVEDIAIPDTLQGVLTARIDRLEEEVRRVLRMASVVGRIFVYRVLAAIAGEQGPRLAETPRELHTHLLTLQREEMIRERARVPELEYIFKHHLTQEAAYNGLLRRERRRFHRQVAEALKRLFPDRIEEQLGLLAYHWEAAGEREQAVEYLRRAGEQAAAQYATAEAVSYFSRALDLTPEEDLVEQYDLLLAMARVHNAQMAVQAWSQDLSALQELSEALDDDSRRAEVALHQAYHAYVSGDYPASMAAAQRAIRLARAVHEVAIEAEAYIRWGVAFGYQGRLRASLSRKREALRLARAARLRRVEGNVLYEIGWNREMKGNLASATVCFERSLCILREVGDRRGEGEALTWVGSAYQLQGDYDEARAYCEQAARLFREIGNRRQEAGSLRQIGMVYHELGDYDRARVYYERSLQMLTEAHDRRGESYVQIQLGLLCHLVGDDQTAREYALQAHRGQGGGAGTYRGRAPLCLGHALVGLARLDEARDAYGQALALLQEMGLPHRATEALAGLTRVCLAEGDLSQARAHVQEILSYLEHGTLDGTEEPARVYLTCYRVLKASGDPCTKNVLEEGYRFLQERAAKISDEEERRSYLENVAAHREIVREYARGEQGGGRRTKPALRAG